jgi:glycosyltransferase involved in cell wall biosynthesis
MKYPFVSVVMPCGNEAAFIKKSLDSLCATQYPKDKLEIIVALDTGANDGTDQIIRDVAQNCDIIRVLPNARHFVPFAMNLGIQAAMGDIIIRVDAHCQYPPDYISKCVEYLKKTDAWCVGGPFYNKPAVNTFMAKAICAALSSPFMVADSKFRTKRESMYVETVPFGAFRREVFDKVGLYDERFIRHQDYELCKRIIEFGGKIYMTPEIKNIYHPRKTLNSLLQKARYYGLWDAFSHKMRSYTFAWRHFVPAPFFAGVLFCLALIMFGAGKNSVLVVIGLAPMLIYLVTGLFFSIAVCRKNKLNFLSVLLIPIICFLYHFNFGYGLVKGWALIATGKWQKYIGQEAQ